MAKLNKKIKHDQTDGAKVKLEGAFSKRFKRPNSVYDPVRC
jgi:hypothetical protein